MTEHQGIGEAEKQDNDIASNIQKLAFYNAGIAYFRKAENGVILEPFGGLGRGAITAVEGVKHYACEIEEERAIAFNEAWPDHDIHCGDNLEWLDSGFYADMDVIAVDFDASLDPFDAVEVFLRHANLERYCLAFVTWGFRRSERLKADWKSGKRHTRESIYHRMRQIMIQLAEPQGVSVKSMGMAIPSVGKSSIVIYGAFSLVKKGGTHTEGEIAGEDQELKNTGADAKPVEKLELDKMEPEARAYVLARLQFTPAEIQTLETGEIYERAVLEGEAQVRFALFNAAMAGNPQALKLMAEVIRKRKYQDRLEAKKQQFRRKP